MNPRPNRMSHVVYCVRPENFEAATKLWSTALGVTFEHLDMHDGSLRVSFSLENGVEVIAPAANGPQKFHDFLATNGEGVYTVVYVVTDLDEAEAEVAAQGVSVADRLVYTGRRPWSEEWAVLEERILPPVYGMRITVARMERHDEGSGR